MQFEFCRQSSNLYLVALHLLEVVGDAVGDDHLVDVGLLNQPGVRQQSVRRQRVDLVRAALLKYRIVVFERILGQKNCLEVLS